jgi:hypothetical protein
VSIHIIGGGAAATPLDTLEYAIHVRPSGETVHADDREFDGTSLADATEYGPSGTEVYTEAHHALGIKYTSQAINDIAGKLWALTPSAAPVTLQGCFRIGATDGNYSVVGVVFTDGTAPGSNAVCGGFRFDVNRLLETRHGTITTLSSANSGTNDSGDANISSHVWVRLIWTAANTFKVNYSWDGSTWIDVYAAATSKTMTPTHYGVAVSNWGGNEYNMCALEHLRIDETDLSV